MNSPTKYQFSFFSLVHTIVFNRQLIIQMIKREVMIRYKGSIFGLLWAFFTPIFMLTMYTFVFSVIFKMRWGNLIEGNKIQFATILFVGLMTQNLFAEILNRAPNLILSNVNYVKKVIFPLEVLPVITMGAALFHYLMSLGVLLLAFIVFNGYLHWTFFLMPVVLLPFIILMLGLAWFLVALGVFLRDVGQTMVILTTMLLFLSPVFYPMSAVPLQFRSLMMMNPLTFIIEQSREILIWGHVPNWTGLVVYSFVAIIVAWLGYVFFQKSRKGFADVL